MSRLFIIKLLVICFCIVLTGCERQSYTKAKYVSGYFKTPNGKYKFNNVSRKKAKQLLLKSYDRLYGSYLIAENNEIKVAYCFACAFSNVTIYLPKAYVDKQSIFRIKKSDARYRIGNEPYKSMLHKLDERGHFSETGSISDIERTITRTKIYITLKSLGQTNGDVGNIKLSFSIDEEEYNIDLSLKVERSKRLKWSIGIPATP